MLNQIFVISPLNIGIVNMFKKYKYTLNHSLIYFSSSEVYTTATFHQHISSLVDKKKAILPHPQPPQKKKNKNKRKKNNGN